MIKNLTVSNKCLDFKLYKTKKKKKGEKQICLTQMEDTAYQILRL